jgi:hypothetical protein
VLKLSIGVLGRTINKVGNGDTSSGVLDWTMTGDRSVRPNRYSGAPHIAVKLQCFAFGC